jgi:hypothetical protein
MVTGSDFFRNALRSTAFAPLTTPSAAELEHLVAAAGESRVTLRLLPVDASSTGM